MTNKPTPASQSSPRLIPDAECAQGKCGCTTSGCWDVCSLKRSSAPVVVQTPPAPGIVYVRPEQPSPARGDKDAGPIYFVRYAGQDGWKEATEEAYWLFSEGNRRILYEQAERAPSGELTDERILEIDSEARKWGDGYCEQAISFARAIEREVLARRAHPEGKTAGNAATAASGDLPAEPKQLYYWNGLTLVTVESMREYGKASKVAALADWCGADEGGTQLITRLMAEVNDLRKQVASNAGAAPAIPEGYKVVPVEPTEEMRYAGSWSDGINTANELQDIDKVWADMIAAAPSNPPVGAERKVP